MSRYSLWLTVGIVVVVGLVVVTQWPRDAAPAPAIAPTPVPVPPPVTTAPQPVEPSVSPTSPDTAAPAPAPAPAPARVRAAHPLETQLREATDYLAFARSLLPRAREGDRDAQYYLYAAMDYCRDGYRRYFDEGQKRRSLEEALEFAGNPSGRVREDIQRIQTRCQGLMNSDDDQLAEPEQWLARAARAGVPRAQIEQAARMARNSQQIRGPQGDRAFVDARRMARESLAAGDPAVIWKLGDFSSLLRDAGSRSDIDDAAFTLAACERGLDCGPGSAAAEQLCQRVPGGCQSWETVQDLQLRLYSDPARISERARQINAQIDAADWQGLGLADPPAP